MSCQLTSVACVCQKKTIQFVISGDFLILNETIESKCVLYHWPRVHRLEYKIQNHDDLLSFAQIDILDTDVGRRNIVKNFGFIDFRFSQEPHEVHINTQSSYYEILVVGRSKISGFVKIYHKAPENLHHLTRLFPSFFPVNSRSNN